MKISSLPWQSIAGDGVFDDVPREEVFQILGSKAELTVFDILLNKRLSDNVACWLIENHWTAVDSAIRTLFTGALTDYQDAATRRLLVLLLQKVELEKRWPGRLVGLDFIRMDGTPWPITN
jgi:hypothetical protein